eukprot:gene43302-26256_t
MFSIHAAAAPALPPVRARMQILNDELDARKLLDDPHGG